MRTQIAVVEKDAFSDAREQFDSLIDRLRSEEANALTHSDLEVVIGEMGTELLRRLLQAHIDQRGTGDIGDAVVGPDGAYRHHKRSIGRGLMSVFGEVGVDRRGYRSREANAVFPLDADLNLPLELYSHGVRKHVAVEASKGSFDDALESLSRTTGAKVPKRQAEELSVRAARDFDAFYESRKVDAEGKEVGAIVVLTTDAKGVPMRRADLREATRRAAETRSRRLEKRLSKGEKRHTRRMATVASVYDIERFARTPEEVMREYGRDAEVKWKRPRPQGKRVWASLVHSPEEVIDEMFQEGARRNVSRRREWVGLVDGSEAQLRRVKRAAGKHKVELTIILDLVHVIEYVWKAAYAFHDEGSKPAERWVRKRLLQILRGRASHVAAGMRRSATLRGLRARRRKPVDTCADYLLKYARHLRYDEYLARGLPIATGVIEGACRHLIQDRLVITGARWSLEGAEAVLRLRALRASGDFEEYWKFHETAEHKRNYGSGIRAVNRERSVRPTLELVRNP